MAIICQILLNETKEGIYRCGDPVRGTLKFRLNERTMLEYVNLRLKGQGKCSWSENKNDSITWYTGEEEFVSECKSIVEKAGFKDAGDYSYPFEFILPDGLPSKYSDTIGSITYKVLAEFKEPGIFGKTGFDAEIPVFGYVEPCSPQPLIFGLSKEPFSLTSNKNSINIKMEIEKTFLSSGESINLKCCVTNETDVPVTSIKTKLVNETTYFTTSGNYRNIVKLTVPESVVVRPGVDGNSVSNFSYVVPTPSYLYSIQHSKILTRVYKLRVTAVLPFPHKNASVEIPVVIGMASPTTKKEMELKESELLMQKSGLM